MASSHGAQRQSTTHGLMARIMAERAAESRPTHLVETLRRVMLPLDESN